MITVEELNVIIEAKVDKAIKDLKKFQGQTGKTEKSVGALAKTMLKKATAAAAAYASIQMVTKFVAESAEAASAAQETYAKFGTVFDDVGDQAANAAKKLADDFGLASSTSRKLLSDTGDLLTGFGLTAGEALKLSDQTNRLAMDLASFTNAQGGAEAVSHALTSAYAGEREALKTYGIVVNEEMVKAKMLEQAQAGLTFATEQQAKISATLAIATEQSKNAIGDFARTSDSAANVQRTLAEQTKRLKENYGALVLEGLTPVRKMFRSLLDTVNDNLEQNKKLKDALDAVYGRSENNEQSEQLKALESGLAEIETRIESVNESMNRNFNATETWQKQLIARSAAALEQLELEKESLEERISIIRRAVEEQEAAERGAALLAEKEKEAADEAERLADAAAALAEINRIAAEQRAKMSRDYEYELKLLNTEDELQKEILKIERDREDAIKEANDKYVKTGEEIQLLNLYYDTLIDKARKAAEAAGDMDDILGNISTGPFRDMNAAISTVSDSIVAMTEEWERSFERQKQAAEDAKKTDIELLKERLEKHLSTANQILSAYSGLTSALSYARQAEHEKELSRIDAQIEAAREAGRDTTALEEKKEKITQRFKRKQWAADKRGKLLQAGIDVASAITEALPNIPLSITVGALGAAQIGTIAAAKNPYYAGGVIPEPVLGVGMRSGQSYSFGERGPETVIPNGGSIGGGITVNINAAIGSRDEITEWVVEGINRAKKMGAVAIA